MSATLMTGALSGTFRPSKAIMVVGDRITLDFALVTTGGPTAVEWYMEFGDTAECGFREVVASVEDTDVPGALDMANVVRTFRETDGSGLANGAHQVSVPLVVKHDFARVMLRVASGACRVTLTAPFGQIAA